jgi:hypothetical protein
MIPSVAKQLSLAVLVGTQLLAPQAAIASCASDLLKKLVDSGFSRDEILELCSNSATAESTSSQPVDSDSSGTDEGNYTPSISLRYEPMPMTEVEIMRMFAQRGFYDEVWNPEGQGIANDFVQIGAHTITDRATGVMWQKSGSNVALTFKDAQAYINKLNENQFAGYSDWRIPTLEEAGSLLQPRLTNKNYLPPLFDEPLSTWTSDSADTTGAKYRIYRDAGDAWPVSFTPGLYIDPPLRPGTGAVPIRACRTDVPSSKAPASRHSNITDQDLYASTANRLLTFQWALQEKEGVLPLCYDEMEFLGNGQGMLRAGPIAVPIEYRVLDDHRIEVRSSALGPSGVVFDYSIAGYDLTLGFISLGNDVYSGVCYYSRQP